MIIIYSLFNPRDAVILVISDEGLEFSFPSSYQRYKEKFVGDSMDKIASRCDTVVT